MGRIATYDSLLHKHAGPAIQEESDGGTIAVITADVEPLRHNDAECQKVFSAPMFTQRGSFLSCHIGLWTENHEDQREKLCTNLGRSRGFDMRKVYQPPLDVFVGVACAPMEIRFPSFPGKPKDSARLVAVGEAVNPSMIQSCIVNHTLESSAM